MRAEFQNPAKITLAKIPLAKGESLHRHGKMNMLPDSAPDQIGFDLPLIFQEPGSEKHVSDRLGALSLVPAALDWLNAHSSLFLTPSELDTILGAAHPLRRTSLLMGRYAAKRALRMLHPECSWQACALHSDPLGAPFFVGEDLAPLIVSLSHCESLALAAVFPQGCRLGVDIECLRPDLVESLASHSPDREIALFPRELDWSLGQKMLALWCLKEALAKALKKGFTLPFYQFDISDLTFAQGWLQARFSKLPDYHAQCLWTRQHCLALAFAQPGTLIIDTHELCRTLAILDPPI
ncbi:MAG: 4'-phosphopantetheinyl transferase superfamily protein [Alphaproteobacteria bacterium]|nr:4'-phosphopantetheinyl transferase superfamily protein [Alphaproteobacteria bacterium]